MASMGKRRWSGRGRGSIGGAHSELNLTPLMDVLLVLLVIFMVTAPMMQSGIPVNLPQAGAAQQTDGAQATPIDVSISDRGAIYVGDELVPLDQLSAKVRAGTKNPQDASGLAEPALVRLRADKDLPCAKVVEVLDVLARSGVKVLLVTQVAAPGAPQP